MTDLKEIEKLFELKEKGIISEAEFEATKIKLLDASSSDITATQAYKDYWKKSFVWRGRATRAEYWWPYLFNMLVAFVFNLVFGIISIVKDDEIFATVPYVLLGIVMLFPNLAVTVRRFHDLGKSALLALAPIWILLGLSGLAFISIFYSYLGMPISSEMRTIMGILLVLAGFSLPIVSIIWLVLLCLPGQKISNKYGNPR
ncbi:MAG: DUF805 domain-containing protein [Alphaproteobacteria bacterium]|nr:DUF805 domain-containing protein [Alphaproteobacteria bacterium]